MRRCTVFLITIMWIVGCSSSSSRLLGSMSEPQEIEAVVPFIDTDSVPLLYGFVSDSFENAVFPINLSLRRFVESDVPYFPLRIPVGRYPTRLAVDNSQKRLFVLNFLDKNISVVDTVNLVEKGFSEFKSGKIIYNTGGKPNRKEISLFASDMKVVHNSVLDKELLLVVGVDNEFIGHIQIIDIDEKNSDGTINVELGKTIFDVSLDIFPTVMAISEDGDTIFIGSKNKNKFAYLVISAQGISYIDTNLRPDLIRLNGKDLFLIDTDVNMFSVYNSEEHRFVSMLPDDIFGKITNRPFQTERVRDLVFSKDTDIEGIVTPSGNTNSCKGTVGYIINAQGNLFVIDVSGCSRCEEADINLRWDLCYKRGWFNMPVENELISPTVSRPLLSVDGRVLSYNEQGLQEYPYIDRWDNSERNFGIAISKLFRANMFNREIQITYEGAVIEGTGRILGGFFIPDITGFENLNIIEGDILDLRDINGNQVKNCDDGRTVDSNEFFVKSLSSDGIAVNGNFIPDDCLRYYYFIIRPHSAWAVHITDYGFLGRAFENQPFVIKDRDGNLHLQFTIVSGKEPSKREMRFYSKIFLTPYGFSPGERLFTPASMKVVQDPVDKNRYWGLIVYTGSQAIWQFSAKDLDSTSSVIYK
ncbi:MAG: YncE family protein [Myxococcota bacterium]